VATRGKGPVHPQTKNKKIKEDFLTSKIALTLLYKR
jgi:hypothetical protein